MTSMRRHSERGAATTELVLMTPVLVAMLLLVVALGRVASARADVEAAARDAARAAANARSASAGLRDGDLAARASVDEGGVECRSLSVTLDTTEFRAGGSVAATVSCTVALGDLAGIGLPASRTITAHFTAPIDRYRGLS
jgi:Flp pilus assembly protein TadG